MSLVLFVKSLLKERGEGPNCQFSALTAPWRMALVCVDRESVCRSGKTSIQEVLFNSLPPKQTFYLEMTRHVTKHTYECVVCPRRRCAAHSTEPPHQHSHSAGDMGLPRHGRP